MEEKSLPSTLDAALSHVNPDRRRLLGLLLTGAVVAPLLTSTALAAGVDPPAKSKSSGKKITGTPTSSGSNGSNSPVKGSYNVTKNVKAAPVHKTPQQKPIK